MLPSPVTGEALAEVERGIFFRFLRLLLDFVPEKLLSPLCQCLWDAEYPFCLWANDINSGHILEHGSDEEDDFALPGDVVTGGVVKPNGAIVWTRVKTSSDLRSKLQKGDTLRIGTEKFTLAGDPTSSQLLLNRPFFGGGGTFNAFKTRQAVPPAKMRNGRKIEDRIMSRLRSGCLENFDTTAFNVFLLGCTHKFLPVAYPDQAAYTAAAATAATAGTTIPWNFELAFRVKAIINIRNSQYGHRTGSCMPKPVFDEVVDQIKQCIAASAAVLGLEQHAAVLAEFEDLCTAPTAAQEEQVRLQEKLDEQNVELATARINAWLRVVVLRRRLLQVEARKKLYKKTSSLFAKAVGKAGVAVPPHASPPGLIHQSSFSESTTNADDACAVDALANAIAEPRRKAEAALEEHEALKAKEEDERRKAKKLGTRADRAAKWEKYPSEVVNDFIPKGDSGSFTSARLRTTVEARSGSGGGNGGGNGGGGAGGVSGDGGGEKVNKTGQAEDAGGHGSSGAMELAAGTQLEGVVSYYICEDKEQDKDGQKGGQGQVYKAYINSADSTAKSVRSLEFALKRPAGLKQYESLVREAQVYFNIDPRDTPHLAFLSDVVRHGGVPLLVMPWAAGGSLKGWLSQQQQLRERCSVDRLPSFEGMVMKQGLGNAIQIARGLASLHDDLGMVHQDLKPGIVVTGNKTIGNLCRLLSLSETKLHSTLMHNSPHPFQEMYSCMES
jgi:hypothetical protein